MIQHPKLSEKGLTLLVALLRYVEQHGNVMGVATQAAYILRSACGDEERMRYVEGIGMTFDNDRSIQAELRAALRALPRPARPASAAQPS